MTIATTQSDFSAHMKDYLDRVNKEDETVFVARSNDRSVVVISKEKLDALERTVLAKKGSLEYAIARDQLIQRQVLLDDEIVASNTDYWGQFDK